MLTALFARGNPGPANLPGGAGNDPGFWIWRSPFWALLTFDAASGSWSYAFIGGAIVAGLWVNPMRVRLTAEWLVPLTVIRGAPRRLVFPARALTRAGDDIPAGAALARRPPGAMSDRGS